VPGNGFFAPTSPWNAAVAPSTPLDSQSPARIAALVASIAASVGRYQPPAINVSQFSTPLYVVGPDTPGVSVKIDNQFGGGLRAALSTGVPIPSTARAAGGTDAHLSVYQPSSDTLWEFWGAWVAADGWHASWGGAMRQVSSNPGYYSNSVWPGASDNEGWSWGATASSLPVAAGLIRSAEIVAGSIPHALAVGIPDACAGAFVWPAQRMDGTDSNANCLPEGAKLRLDPSVNVDALPLSPIGRVIARAAQQYGMIVRDVTHSALVFYAEDPATGGTTAYGAGGPLGDVTSAGALSGFPWGSLQMVAAPVCMRAPCG
jgi:hypothetical protein